MRSWNLAYTLCLAILMPFAASGNECEDYCEVEPCMIPVGNFQIYGDYLYWKVSQDQMQYAAVLPGGIQQIIQDFQTQESSVRVSEKLKIIDPKFDFQSGFRIGLGYIFPCSNWDVQLAWTSIHEKTHSQVSNRDQGIIPLAMPVSSIFGFINRDPALFGFGSKAKSNWHFEFDVIDLEIGRNCACSDQLVLRPYVGLKMASIRQKQHIDYFGFSVDGTSIGLANKKKNDFQGIGPSFGVDFGWGFCSNWSLSGSLSGALLCGKLDVKERPVADVGPNSITFELKNSKKNRVRSVVAANLGIDWATCICNKVGALIGVYYEAQYWPNQWNCLSSVASGLIVGGNSPQGDLMMQGLTAKVALSF